MPSGGRRRRGRGLGFAGRTEDRINGRRTGCGGSGEPDPAEKRSSSSSSKAVEADCSPEAAERTKELRKRSELRKLLWRARSMVELRSVCRRVCQWGRCHVTGEKWRDGDEYAGDQREFNGRRADAELGSTSLWRSQPFGETERRGKRWCEGVEIRAPFRRIRFWTDHSWAQSSSGSGRAGTHQARVIP